MTAHIQLPALDPRRVQPGHAEPADRHGPAARRDEVRRAHLHRLDGHGRGRRSGCRRARPRSRAIKAGNDIVLHSPDDAAAVAGIKAAVEKGEIPHGADRRVGAARPAREGAARPAQDHGSCRWTTCRRSSAAARTRAVAQAAQPASRSRCIKDDRNQVPLRVPREASVLYLSVLDYPSGWRIAAPSRTFLPELRQRWPGDDGHRAVGSIDDRRRSISSAPRRARYDAIVASVFVRAASGSGRMDLAPPLVRLLSDLARATANTPQAVHHGVLRQSRTCPLACRRCRRCC